VLLAFERQVRERQILGPQRFDHAFSLRRRHHPVFESLEQDHRARQPVGEVDRRPLVIHSPGRRIGTDQPIEVARLELVGVDGQGLTVRDPVVGRAGREVVMKNERAQRRVPAGAAAANRQPLAVDFATSPENRKIMELIYSSETFGRPYMLAPDVPADRLRGHRMAIREAGLAPRADYVAEGEFTLDGGRVGAGRRFELDLPPTAVVASSDQMAIGIIRALHEMGRAVPQDISIVGFDDSPLAAHAVPALTSVAIPMYEMGCRATVLLLCLLRGEPGAGIVLPVELRVRETTAPPRNGTRASVS